MTAGFAVAVVVLIAIAVFAYFNARSYVATTGLVSHTHRVIETLSDIDARLNEAESQQRAYLITADAKYLQWRDRVFAEIDQHIDKLRELTTDNVSQQERIPDLKNKIAARLETMEGTRQLRDAQDLEAVRKRISSGVGMTAMDSVRSVLRAMESEERRLLETRNARVRESVDVLLGICVTAIVVISLFLRRLTREIREQMDSRALAEQTIKILNTDLQAQAAQLRVANQELESFSYSVSHDLRVPLRAIDGFALMLEEDYGKRLDGEASRYISVIRKNSKRMGVLIDDLLAFSRLGRQAIQKADLDMGKLVHEVIDEALAQRADKPPRIQIGQLPPARADRALLRQVWLNLISNALKYSSKSPDPIIEVSGFRADIENVYSVKDNGAGFDMQYVDKLFGVFQRLHREEDFSGTGVGLAIVRRLVMRHGGRVWAKGVLNEGAVFSFTLPVGNAHGQA